LIRNFNLVNRKKFGKIRKRESFQTPVILLLFFCDSDTTLAIVENLGRRWLGCGLSKFAIQVTRKRLLDNHNSKDLMEAER